MGSHTAANSGWSAVPVTEMMLCPYPCAAYLLKKDW